mmetsp:Transcript_11323/g.14787  ORF Transcript_11323/g.14787 Transcript_11323/m.14787 type:complete len:120 (-) Transcript_11323:451-810(-)|eukprot:CAMPEP_0116063078 /NCGR_PEP_ID=MMETSP0322-20121206/8193_1 /TAXON_ID=163516 /ORGANISM="Leptocylindrus danicus var. apora, Strain B651" /LENGTH=119 /DNA_ID=CAMNT_0003548613 /DNA_START=176 /DNA_END=535 /DNA_ORIENTATION=-
MVHGRAGFKLEAAKFGLYIGLPILATISVNDPDNVRWMIDYFQYIKYPPTENVGSDEEPLADKINNEIRRRLKEKEAMEQYREQVKQLGTLENERNARMKTAEESSKGNGIWGWFGYKN